MVVVYSPQEMQKVWQKIALEHQVIFLNWELWAGKTTFVKWYVEWLGIISDVVHSPTYTYMNIYDNKVLHIDMYRLESFEEAVEKWIISHLNDYKYILIERPKWKDKLGLVWVTDLKITKMDENTRDISIL